MGRLVINLGVITLFPGDLCSEWNYTSTTECVSRGWKHLAGDTGGRSFPRKTLLPREMTVEQWSVFLVISPQFFYFNDYI